MTKGHQHMNTVIVTGGVLLCAGLIGHIVYLEAVENRRHEVVLPDHGPHTSTSDHPTPIRSAITGINTLVSSTSGHATFTIPRTLTT